VSVDGSEIWWTTVDFRVQKLVALWGTSSLVPSRLGGLPDTVEVRQHDIAREELESGS
jgi:hypothetical protein